MEFEDDGSETDRMDVLLEVQELGGTARPRVGVSGLLARVCGSNVF